MSASKAIGIRLERKKEASLLNWNLKRPYPPEKVCIPLPRGSRVCVRPGEDIQTGQKIADPQGPDNVTAHASMAGTVENIAQFSNPLGEESLCVEIRRQREPKVSGNVLETRKGWEQLSNADLLEIFRGSGLVTTDSKMEPVHAKIQKQKPVKTILINGCEPEPYVTCEQILVMAHPLEVLRGAEILRQAAGAEKILFVFEECNLEMIELIKSKIFFLKWNHVEIRAVAPVYPQGLGKILLREWFDAGDKPAVPTPIIPTPQRRDGATAMDQKKIKVEAIVFQTSTAYAVYEAVAQQKPFYERITTVAGECVVEPRSLWLPIGISFYDAILACKGVMRGPGKVIMGGPMAGITQTDLGVPVMAGTTAIIALPPGIVRDEAPCIRCNRCVDVCPVSISPVMITLASEQKEFELAREWGAEDCIECGNCGYTCPSNRPMLELLRRARAFVRGPAVKKEAVHHA